jgi:PAS domain S-box-containing protein
MVTILDYQLRQREYLLQIARAMTARLDLTDVLNMVIRYAVELLGGRVGVIALRQEDDSFAILASYGVDRRLLPRFRPLLTDIPLTPRPTLGGKWVIPRLETRLAAVTTASGINLQQVVALPMVADEQLIGLIYVFRAVGAPPFTAADEELLAAFADQAAVAVRNARLFQRVNEERRRLEAIIEHSADGVLILDADGRVLIANRALERLTGWRREDAMGEFGSRVLGLVNDQGVPVYPPKFPVRGPSNETPRLEGYLIRPDGRRGPFVSVVYAPLYDDDGRLFNVVINVTDLSRFKEAEEIKSTFISAISHELKTPIALIQGYAETLARTDVQWDEETVRESLAVIRDESDRLNKLVNNLLDAARIQAGALRLQFTDVRLDELARKTVEDFKTMDAGQHRFSVDFPPDFPVVQADPERIRQVLSNLLSNAIKYSPPGTEIRVAGWYDPRVVGVSVSDEGPGIPLEEQQRIFERFVRGESAGARRTEGAGLGLFICKALVEGHGGRIWVESRPERGSTFYFTLPRGEQHRLPGPRVR